MSGDDKERSGDEPSAPSSDDDQGTRPEEADEADDAPASASEADDAKARAKERVKAEAYEKAKSKALARKEDVAATDGDADAAGDRRDLPKWNRARVKRKAPVGEEQDAFQAGVRQAGRGAVRRAPILLIAVVLIASGIGGWIWWRGRAAAESAQATQLLAVAAGYQARGVVDPELETVVKDRQRPPAKLLVKDDAQLRQTIDEALRQLDAQGSGTAAARLGELVRASRAMREGRFSDAESQYRAFADAHPSHDLQFLAREGILLAREAQGDRDGAIAEADILIGSETGTFYRDQGLWQKGRLLEAAGRSDEALAVYRQYAEEYPLEQTSIAKAQIIERLRELDPSAVPAGAEAGDPAAAGLDLGALLQ